MMKNSLLIILTTIVVLGGCEKVGLDGKNSLMDFIAEPAGENCAWGGYKIITGLDLDDNGILDENEIQKSEYVCNGNTGAAGSAGADGSNSLLDVVAEPAGENCASGGLKIISGFDLNNNTVLDENEISNTKFVCNGDDGSNGANGSNSLLDLIAEPVGENCSAGGFKLISGFDENSNNVLDNDEIINTEYICNGADGNNGINGQNSLIDMVAEPAGENCSSGGYKLVSGFDTNNNNILDASEIQYAEYVCNGNYAGLDKVVRLPLYEMGTAAFGNYGSTEGFFITGVDKFDKTNWVGVDSIVFVTSMKTSDAAFTGYVDLYDVTNDRVIENGTVSTNSTEMVRVFSSNIYKNLPSEEIELAFQLRSVNNTVNTYMGKTSYLLLYRYE